jgi:hypothetical protein
VLAVQDVQRHCDVDRLVGEAGHLQQVREPDRDGTDQHGARQQPRHDAGKTRPRDDGRVGM